MTGLPDLLLVGVIVVAAVACAARTLGPRSWRARRGAAKSAACGGCDGCASPAPGTAETRIPVAAIGRRRAPDSLPQNHV